MLQRPFVTGWTLAVLIALFGQTASAAVTLTDLNSSATFDGANPSNQVSWIVDGVSQLFQQSFYFRVGSTGDETTLSTGFTSETQLDPSFFRQSYVFSGFTVDVSYTLTGGSAGSGESDLNEVIRIRNTGATALDMHFFQYVDFDLGGSPGNDYGWVPAFGRVAQAEPGTTLAETVVTPVPDHYEMSLYPSILNSFSDGLPTQLSDTPGVYPAGFVFGDVAWAFEWDETIGVGGTFIISKDKNITSRSPENGPLVPEPASMVIWGVGAGAMGLAGFWRRKRVAV